MSSIVEKVCVVCHRDVANSKRVKDTKGRYYCAACHEALLRRTTPEAGKAAESPKAQAAADDGLLSLADEGAPVASAVAAPPVGSGALKLPETCPNCGTRVMPNRRLCIKCNRDVTQMEKLQEKRAQWAKDGAQGEKAAMWLGRVMRVGMWVVILGLVGLSVWGIKMMCTPAGPWDNYPKTREAAAREFMQAIATGTDKSYDKAFMLISFRMRAGDASIEQPFKNAFRRMHDDLVKKYGNDWISKMKLESMGGNDDEVDFIMTLGQDTHTIGTQVQLDSLTVVSNLSRTRDRPVYMEDGKNHFGVLEVSGYPLRAHPQSPNILGPGNAGPMGGELPQ